MTIQSLFLSWIKVGICYSLVQGYNGTSMTILFSSLFIQFLLVMISNFGSSLIFNEIEYFTFINLLLLSLFFFYVMLFFIIYSSSLLLNSIFYSDSYIELIITFVSLLYVILIISPGLLLFLDYDLIISSSFLLYVTGFQ